MAEALSDTPLIPTVVTVGTSVESDVFSYDDREVEWLLKIFRHREECLTLSDLTNDSAKETVEQQREKLTEFFLRFAEDPWCEGRFQVELDDGGTTVRWLERRPIEDPAAEAEHRQTLIAGYRAYVGEVVTPSWSQEHSALYPNEEALEGIVPAAAAVAPLRQPGHERNTRAFSHEVRVDLSGLLPITTGGLKIGEFEGQRVLVLGGRRLPLGGTTARIVEIVALNPRGISFVELRRVIRAATGKDIAPEGLNAHLEAAGKVLGEFGVDTWSDQMVQGAYGRQSRTLKFENAAPRDRADWPAYLMHGRQRCATTVAEPALQPELSELMAYFTKVPEWTENANCRGQVPEVFYPEKGGSTMAAKFICSRCDVIDKCMEWALEQDKKAAHNAFGVAGGLAPKERYKVLKVAKELGEEAARTEALKLREKGLLRAQKIYRTQGLVASWATGVEDDGLDEEDDTSDGSDLLAS